MSPTSQPIQLSIVAPCLNEEAVLRETVSSLKGVLSGLIESGKAAAGSQIVFVDDGSTDRTWDIIQELCADPMVAGVSLSRNFGHQNALLAGLHLAACDAVVSVDADLQDDVSVIESMVDCYRHGFDIVYGVRRSRKTDSYFKEYSARGFYRLMQWLGTKTVYNHADFRLMSRRAIQSLTEFREASLFLRGIVPLLGYRSCSIYYDRQPRRAGQTKYSLWKMLKLSLAAVSSFSNLPLRLITGISLVALLALAAIGGWALWVRLFTSRAVPGWTSTLLPILLAGGLNLFAIGVLGEYVARIFAEVKGRPRFIVAETRNLPASRVCPSCGAPVAESRASAVSPPGRS